MKRITVYENENDTMEWLTDPDTDEVPDGAIDAYYDTVRKALKERFPGFKIDFVNRGVMGAEFMVEGVDAETEYKMTTDTLPYVYTDILDDMGNDWSWYPA